MPKKKEAVAETTTRFPRRAASKEALKQMLKITAQAEYDSPETLEIPSDDDEVVTIDPAPKKKYRLSHRKSADGNDRDVIVLKSINYENDPLVLDSWTDELSPAQIAMKNAASKEIQEINDRLERLLKETSSEVIFTGDNTALYELEQEIKQAAAAAPAVPQAAVGKRASTAAVVQQQSVKNSQGIQLVMDARSGVVVGTMTPATTATLAAVNSVATVKPPQTRKRTRAAANLSPAPTPPQPAKVAKTIVSTTPASTPSAAPTPSQKATEATAVGGLSHGSSQKPAPIVDLTADDGRSAADSREVAFNKLQGKTFPSLVVVARPYLRAKDSANSDRPKLDSKVKAVLMHPPTKFTEWLIQVGLIRSEQTCASHPQNKLKLGMYSDVTKFPFSGGYVWISECCPQRFVSVFSGSLFEGSPHPPSVILKLIYHWACQTNVQNVVQWVKVDNLYVKGMNTWLRATCTVAIHSHLSSLGNPSRKVEVGVISLGTTSQDGNQRQVKVEVLGVLDVTTKLIRLRAVEPMLDGDRNYRKRFSKILEPLIHWVHPSSIIVTDLTVDKSTLHALGFKNVLQSSSNDNVSNHTIMDYLRRIVPRMFQNTLSLLSRQIIQQFLDELVWREWFGTTPASAFDNIIVHLAEQTKSDGVSLVHRLTKIASNPFKNWCLKNTTPSTLPAASPAALNKGTSLPPLQPLPLSTEGTKRTYKTKKTKAPSPAPEASKQRKSVSPDIPEQMVPLEHYYYGTLESTEPKMEKVTSVTYKCGICKAHYTNNIKLMVHLFTHVSHNAASTKFFCRYCLITVNSADLLEKHVHKTHPSDTKIDDNFVCIICEGKFYNSYSLGKHMSREHVPSELPYQCSNVCRFRCSSHKQIVDHFYSSHDGGNMLQCPLCLKSMTVASNGRALTQNMSYFVQHLQKHHKKMVPKKCPKCALWFIQKDILKYHLQEMHVSMRRKAGLVPWPVPRSIIMVPKSRQEEPVEQQDVNITNLIFTDISDTLLCKECDTTLNAKNHFPSVQNCLNDNCQYTTCCKKAMTKHALICKDLHISIPSLLLPFKMYCVCGHSDLDGNSMAKHLTVCERKSAYPSETEAKAATVTHSMLDVLGLMRRTEEPSTSTYDIIREDERYEPRETTAAKHHTFERGDDEDVIIEEVQENANTSQDLYKNEDDPMSETTENNREVTVEESICKSKTDLVLLNRDSIDLEDASSTAENVLDQNGINDNSTETVENIDEAPESMDVDDAEVQKKADGNMEVNTEASVQ